MARRHGEWRPDTITARERVRGSAHFQAPDRIPHFLPHGGENDILWLWPPPLPPQQDWTNKGGTDWMTDGLFKRCQALISLDDLFIAFYEAPEHLRALLERLCEQRPKTVRLHHSLGCDGVMDYEDWGLQDRLMVSLDTIREFFLPRHQRTWGLAHELGMDNWMQSCGYTIEVLPLFAEAGLDVAQLDQQESMGLENLDQVLGGKLAFWCPVDIQRTMVEGSEADIEAYVRRMIATLGGHRGGLISKTYPTPDDVHHEPAKIAAACAAFRRWGGYDQPPASVDTAVPGEKPQP